MLDSLTNDVGKVDASRQVDAIRRRWILVAAITVCFGVAAAVITMFLPRTYESTTSVLVAPVASGTDADIANARTKGEINLDTEAQIVRSVALAEDVADEIRFDLPAREIAEAVSVTVPANSQVLNITFEAATAESARAGAEAYAQAYLDQRRAGSEELIAEAKSALEDQLAVLQEQFTAETARSQDKASSEVERAIASSRRDVLIGQISTLDAGIASLTRSTVNPGHVLSAANFPSSPTSPSQVINLAAGLLVGLLVGLGLAVAMGMLDHRVRKPRDLRVPRTVRVHADLLTAASTTDDLNVSFDEEVDQLRIAVDSTASEDPRTVLVAPVGPESASDLIALSLGRAYARRLGRAVYAVTNTEVTTTHELGIDGPGLTDLISGDTSVVPVPLDASGLSGLGPGTAPERLSGLLQRPKAMERVIGVSDAVLVVASSGVHHSAGAQSMLGAMDRVVLIGRSGKLDDRELARVLESIDRSQFRGTVTVALVASAGRRRGAGRPPSSSRRTRRAATATTVPVDDERLIDAADDGDADAVVDAPVDARKGATRRSHVDPESRHGDSPASESDVAEVLGGR